MTRERYEEKAYLQALKSVLKENLGNGGYSIFQGSLEDSVCLDWDADSRKYVVFYFERGREHKKKYSDTFLEACSGLFTLISHDDYELRLLQRQFVKDSAILLLAEKTEEDIKEKIV